MQLRQIKVALINFNSKLFQMNDDLKLHKCFYDVFYESLLYQLYYAILYYINWASSAKQFGCLQKVIGIEIEIDVLHIIKFLSFCFMFYAAISMFFSDFILLIIPLIYS